MKPKCAWCGYEVGRYGSKGFCSAFCAQEGLKRGKRSSDKNILLESNEKALGFDASNNRLKESGG